ncbi:MAG: putative lipid II flippase FtsW [Spirochaetota bacterium]
MDVKAVIDTRRKGEPEMGLFIVAFILIGIGIAMTYSASALFAERTFGDSLYFLKRQLLWSFIGFIVMMFVQQIDYRNYQQYTKIMLAFTLVTLVLVLIPGVGISVKGSSRWLGYGLLRFQPSELVKLFIVIYFAKVFSYEHQRDINVLQLLLPLLIVGVFFLLIMLQPDFGTAIDVAIISVVLLFVSGFPLIYMLGLAVLSVPMFYLLIYQVEYRRDRILAFLDPWSDRFGKGYHIIQSFIAFKLGGLLGAGLGSGTQKIKRLPEPHTDFIFAVIAEETGLLGTFSVVILYLLFFYFGAKIALRAPDEYGRLLAMGLTLLVTVQAFLNISVVIGVLPTTGIPLPFISYGGSSLVVTMIGTGILLNISKYREVVAQELKYSGEVWV